MKVEEMFSYNEQEGLSPVDVIFRDLTMNVDLPEFGINKGDKLASAFYAIDMQRLRIRNNKGSIVADMIVKKDFYAV